MRIIVGPFHGAQFLLNRKLFSGLEQQHLQAVTRKDVSGHSARRARPDDDRIVISREIYFRLGHRETFPLTRGNELYVLAMQNVDYAKSHRSMFEKNCYLPARSAS